MIASTGMHQISHALGVGNSARWASFVSNGFYTGPLGTDALRKILNNDTARLNADGLHFWPYGINHAEEEKNLGDLVNHCKIMDAIYKDLFHETVYLEGRIRSVSTKQCITIAGGALAMGSCTDSSSLMRIVSIGDVNPVYRIERGDMVLDAPTHTLEAGDAMEAYAWNGGSNQEVKIEDSPIASGRASRLKMVHSNMYLHPSGTSIIQDAPVGSEFDWELVKGTISSEESTYLEGRIRNVNTQQCITRVGGGIGMGPCTDTASFVRIVAMGKSDPVYRLEFGLDVLDAPDWSTQAGLAMIVYAWNGGGNQEFKIEDSPQSAGQTHRLKMVHSDLYLQPAGSVLVQDAETAGPDLEWELIKGAVPAPTRLLARPSIAPNANRLLIDALGRKLPGARGKLPFTNFGAIPVR
jgi:hypothetical protein